MQEFDALAESSGSDRSSLLKTLVRRGMKELRMEQAVDAFRKQQATLSRAAEIAGVSPWDFASRMKDQSLELHYDVAEFEEDLAVCRGKP